MRSCCVCGRALITRTRQFARDRAGVGVPRRAAREVARRPGHRDARLEHLGDVADVAVVRVAVGVVDDAAYKGSPTSTRCAQQRGGASQYTRSLGKTGLGTARDKDNVLHEAHVFRRHSMRSA